MRTIVRTKGGTFTTNAVASALWAIRRLQVSISFEHVKQCFVAPPLAEGLIPRASRHSRAGCWSVRGSNFCKGTKFFSCSKNVQLSSGSHPASYSVRTETSLSANQPQHETDHSTPSSVKAKNQWSYTSIPVSAFMACTDTASAIIALCRATRSRDTYNLY